eukprot:6641035-Alexandrium_andersonii.AAC.1
MKGVYVRTGKDGVFKVKRRVKDSFNVDTECVGPDDVLDVDEFDERRASEQKEFLQQNSSKSIAAEVAAENARLADLGRSAEANNAAAAAEAAAGCAVSDSESDSGESEHSESNNTNDSDDGSAKTPTPATPTTRRSTGAARSDAGSVSTTRPSPTQSTH